MRENQGYSFLALSRSFDPYLIILCGRGIPTKAPKRRARIKGDQHWLIDIIAPEPSRRSRTIQHTHNAAQECQKEQMPPEREEPHLEPQV